MRKRPVKEVNPFRRKRKRNQADRFKTTIEAAKPYFKESGK